LGNLLHLESNPAFTLGRSEKKRGHEGFGPLTSFNPDADVLPHRTLRFAKPSQLEDDSRCHSLDRLLFQGAEAVDALARRRNPADFLPSHRPHFKRTKDPKTFPRTAFLALAAPEIEQCSDNSRVFDLAPLDFN